MPSFGEENDYVWKNDAFFPTLIALLRETGNIFSLKSSVMWSLSDELAIEGHRCNYNFVCALLIMRLL